jgi:hypothetical protein
VCRVCFHTHRKALTRSWAQKSPLHYLFPLF